MFLMALSGIPFPVSLIFISTFRFLLSGPTPTVNVPESFMACMALVIILISICPAYCGFH